MSGICSLSLPLCANTERTIDDEISPCLDPTPHACQGCSLVQYCSKECQTNHWKVHKFDCKSPLIKAQWRPAWDKEERWPAFMSGDELPIGVQPFGQASHGLQKYLWGNVPAVDLLNLTQNEGLEYSKNFRLLFAASGDIRNIVKSVTELPRAYAGHIHAVLNDRDHDIVARNAIILLTAIHFKPEKAVPMMLHIWYSAFINAQTLLLLQENLLPLVQDVCSKVKIKPEHSLQSKTWTYGTRSLRLVLRKREWDHLLKYFEIPDGLSASRAQTIRTATMLAPERKDYVHRALFSQPPAWRVCTAKFRKDGILLPFGASRREFDVPNPTLYQNADNWPVMDSADPLQGWSIDEVFQKAPPATNDVYGSLFFYVQNILWKFCQRINTMDLSIQLFQMDARELPGVRGMDKHSFDRIEVSNIADRGYVGPETVLATFGPLLKRKTQNPHATLVTLFLNATHEVTTPIDSIETIKASVHKLRPYLQLSREMFDLRTAVKANADIVKLMEAGRLFQDNNALFERYMRDCRFGKIAQAARLNMKAINTIICPWPFQLRANASQHEFDVMLASGHNGSERYVEWESIS